MSIEIKLPELGEGIDSGDVLEVLVREGDTISKDQGIIEVETDKAAAEVPTTAAGKVVKIHVQVGQTVKAGQALITLEPSDAAAGAKESAGAKPAKGQKAKPEKKERMAETPAAKPAAAKERTRKKAEPEEDEADEASPAKKPAEGGDDKKTAPRPAAKDRPEPDGDDGGGDDGGGEQESAAAQTASIGAVPAGPAVRRFAREVGVDLRNVQASGSGGRITREDVLEAVRQANQLVRGGASRKAEPAAPASPPAAPSQGPPAVSPAAKSRTPSLPAGEDATDAWGPIRVARMTKIRKTIAARMHDSWSAVPRVTNFDDADITELERIRQSSKDDYASAGIKLTSMPFVIKSVALALKSHPTINASLDAESESIIYKQYVNIGVAVDTERGLVVPVLRQAERLSIPDIARELATLAENVRTGAFGVEDLRGGTFTISNLGAIGGTYSTPIVNVPEVAILLVGRARKLPVVRPDDAVAVRLMMPLSLSYDHRLVDGATAARFLNDVVHYLEAPSRLLLAV